MTKQIKTLGDLEKVAPMFGKKAQEWVETLIQNSPRGIDEGVEADDTQIMFLLLDFAEKERFDQTGVLQ